MLRKRPRLSLLIVALGLLGLYYLSIPVFGPHFAQVCRKGEYGPPDHCETWDVVTASILRLMIALDEHNGIVAAVAGVTVAVFTGVLWKATDKLWRSGDEQLRHAISSDVTTQRAYLGRRSVNSVEFKTFVTDDGSRMARLEITPVWENNRATPAINVKFCALEPIICLSEPSEGIEPVEIQMGDLPRIAIGARQTMSGGSVAVQIADLIKCSRRECKIYCVFRLEYNDVFPDTPTRIVQYCEELRFGGIAPITDKPIPAGSNIPFVLYGYARFQIYT